MKKKSNITLITGGARSGKSSYALKKAEEYTGKKLFLATCPKIDDETEKRIINHQKERSSKNWDTIEETLNLEEIFINNKDFQVILLDCVTLWINNYLFEHFEKKLSPNIEEDFYLICKRLIITMTSSPAKIYVVSNEVGLGIVPDNALSRLFRDISGYTNRLFAEYADEVFFMSCGIPMKIK